MTSQGSIDSEMIWKFVIVEFLIDFFSGFGFGFEMVGIAGLEIAADGFDADEFDADGLDVVVFADVVVEGNWAYLKTVG